MMKYHIKMKQYDEKGNLVEILPITDASDILITVDGTKLPSNVTNLAEILKLLGTSAFEDSDSLVHTKNDEVISGEKTFTNKILLNGVAEISAEKDADGNNIVKFNIPEKSTN